jgi:predicted Fe-Mo cluster-binding NifX family protein
MIAMPIKTKSESSALAPLFGKAKFFAFIDNEGKISVEENKVSGGMHVAKAFKERGVTTLITAHLGEKPFHALRQAGIKIYCAPKERIEVEEAYASLQRGELCQVTIENYMSLLGEGEHHHGHECCSHEHGHDGECCSHEHEGGKKERCCERKGEHHHAQETCHEGKFSAHPKGRGRCCQRGH